MLMELPHLRKNHSQLLEGLRTFLKQAWKLVEINTAPPLCRGRGRCFAFLLLCHTHRLGKTLFLLLQSAPWFKWNQICGTKFELISKLPSGKQSLIQGIWVNAHLFRNGYPKKCECTQKPVSRIKLCGSQRFSSVVGFHRMEHCHP